MLRDLKRIHKFHLNDVYIVLDINSGAVHLIDNIIYDILEDDFDNIDELIKKYKDTYSAKDIKTAVSEIKELETEDLLFSAPLDFSRIPFSKNNIIKAMCLHVAHDCNLKCRYCFAAQGNFKGERCLMSEEVGRKALEFLVENSGNRRNLEVDFFGGEPLMNFKVIKKLVSYGRELEKRNNKNFRFTLTTNAVLLNDEIIDYLNENMSNVVLSIDGRREINDYMRETLSGKGSYDIILPKIKKFVEKRGDKDYYIRGTFTNKNLDFSKDILGFYKSGFDKVSIEPVVTDEREDYALREEHLEQILKEYEKFSKEYIDIKKKDSKFLFFHFMIDLNQGPCIIKRCVGCGAGNEYVAVTPEGDLYPCHQFVGEKEFLMGSVFNEIVNVGLRETFTKANVLAKEDCRECWAKFYCSGGCHANSWYAHKDLKRAYKIGCEMEKKRIECGISILANLGD